MNEHRQTTRGGNLPASPVRRGSISRTISVLLTVAVIALLGFWWLRTQHPDTPPSISSPEATDTPDFAKLNGRWIRPDGGYVVEIKKVDSVGRMDAAYFNPAPIYVSKAEASMDSGVIRAFIELRAPNYPGSTYTLTYEPESDQLKGIYYQALEQQSYEVVFMRVE